MKYALIGCGRIAPKHIQAITENGVIPAAVCDLSADKAKLLLDNFGLLGSTDIYTDYRLMLEEVSPDITAIAVPSGSHAQIAAECMKSMSNVMIEKPAALSMNELSLLKRVQQSTGMRAGVCHQNRFNLPVRRLKKALQEKRLGKISHISLQVRWHRDRDYYSQAAWRGRWDQDGGVLMNQCIHGIDLLDYMMDSRPISVKGILRNRFHPYIQAEDLGAAIICYENGALGIVEGTGNVYPENLEETLCVFGEKGTVCLGGYALEKTELWHVQGEPFEKNISISNVSPQNVYGYGHSELYREFISAVKNEEPSIIDLSQTSRAVELVLAIYKSHKTGQEVFLPLDDFSTREMEGAFGKA